MRTRTCTNRSLVALGWMCFQKLKGLFSTSTKLRYGVSGPQVNIFSGHHSQDGNGNWREIEWSFMGILAIQCYSLCYSFTWAIYWAIPNSSRLFQPSGITSLPWALKPIIGLVSDMFPLGTGLRISFHVVSMWCLTQGVQAPWIPRWLP